MTASMGHRNKKERGGKGDEVKGEGMRELAVLVEYNHNALYTSITLPIFFIKLTKHRERQI